MHAQPTLAPYRDSKLLSTLVPNWDTLIDLLQERSESQPNTLAYAFLNEQGEITDEITYGELEHKAQAIANKLQEAQAQLAAGQSMSALLLYPSSVEFVAAFFGCIYANVIAIPAYPPQSPRVDRALVRLQAIGQDAGASIVLTTSAELQNVRSALAVITDSTEEVGQIMELPWIATNDIPTTMNNGWKRPGINGESLAYLQYTSGSTGTPNGVMVTHGNLLYDLEMIAEEGQNIPPCFSPSTEDATGGMVSWLPLFHDMGLIYGVLLPLYEGYPCYLMSPHSFMKQPMRWLRAISRYRASHTAAPDFAYALCVRKSALEERRQLDLSHWRIAVNAAEPVRDDTLRDFANAFTGSGFHMNRFMPGYGLAEATLKVTSTPGFDSPTVYSVDAQALEENCIKAAESSNQATVRHFIGCGRPQTGTQAIIVNPKTQVKCAPYIVGEIWVQGPHVANGYWNNSSKTDEVFHGYLQDTGEGPFLRTGDLGFLHEGEVFITGRCKDLMVFRGRNHYPQDIEYSVQRIHSALRSGCGAAFSVDVDGEERLALVQEIHPEGITEAELEHIYRKVRSVISTNHELHLQALSLLPPGSIPKTSSGKIQHSMCKKKFINDRFKPIKEWIMFERSEVNAGVKANGYSGIKTDSESDNKTSDVVTKVAELEQWMVQEVASILMMPDGDVSTHIHLNDLGLDSQETLELIGNMEEMVGRSLPADLVAQYGTINAITTAIAEGAVTEGA